MLIPITENETEVIYQTDAPVEVIDSCFRWSDNVNEFKEDLKDRGYILVRYRFGVSLNFDEK